MEHIPLSGLIIALIVSLVLSGCFSGSETALMTVNRYRLRHLADEGRRGPRIAQRLLERPDRLIGVILIGNNLVNILAAQIATVIALRLGGESAIAVATGLLTLTILIFSEVTPKTLAALHPERVAFPAAFALSPLLRLLYPLVWLINLIANGMLRAMGVRIEKDASAAVSREELRTVVNEAGAMIPRTHQRMLTNILDLEQATVEDIMIPRNEIMGIDLEDDWDAILELLANTEYTRMPVYRGAVDEIEGVLHVRRVLSSLLTGRLTREELIAGMNEPYFVPEATPLHVQLLNFQNRRRRIALVVDEYGDIMGLITLEDLLEEIVGEFTTDPAEMMRDVHPQADGSFLVEGSASVRELNRTLNAEMPTGGPKTLNGLILEQLETIPAPGTSLMLEGYPVTIIQTQGNRVKLARIQPPPGKTRR
ncbi:HlyC/CorC family transporter [Arhodomonas aquaeolei]|uniref:HlyC/CorC family transporter n=1 Tax=Arhodomonas aquaeolei TaxID=2369 RepID=UPI002167AF5C|nr:HlyC/CorC family transporter [Arhodomonas aquaeolei]MCS4504563.1 HlyC/CorC family transporter [Arhodomonas aquaeolei]